MPLGSLARRAAHFCGVLASAALVLMMVATVVDVLMANLLRRPITGIYDLVQLALVLVVFLGFPATFVLQGHIVVDVIDLYVSTQTRRRLSTQARVITTVVLTFLAWNMFKPALDAFRFGERMQELGLPTWVLWVPMIIGVALSAVVAWMAPAGSGVHDAHQAPAANEVAR